MKVRLEHDTDTIVVGAGPAGLAVGACLRRRGIPFVILERADQVAASWRRHYRRLHLHTPKASSALPFLPFSRRCPRYPSRAQVIEYLEAYARHFDLPVRLNEEVTGCRPLDGYWEVVTRKTDYRARRLVLATGFNREPRIPPWAQRHVYEGQLLHSGEYATGEPFRGQRVLVAGMGNSGAEIALDLWEHGAHPAIAVRDGVNVIPRDLFGVPVATIALLESWLPPKVADTLNRPLVRLTIGDLRRHGLKRKHYGPMTEVVRMERIPTIDVGTADLIKRGVVDIRPGVEALWEDGTVFTGGRRESYDAVVLATGYSARLDALLGEGSSMLDADGRPKAPGVDAASQVYFCGFRVAAPGMLREIRREAQHIAARIAARRS